MTGLPPPPPLPPLPETRYCIGVEGDQYEEDRLMYGSSAWDDEAMETYARAYGAACAAAARQEERAAIVKMLEDEHNPRKHRENYALCYAIKIRARGEV